MPDTRAAEFHEQAHAQSAAIAASEHEADDQAFVDAVSWDLGHGLPQAGAKSQL